MTRLGRRTFNALTALSLLLCVAACVLWVRSYFLGDVFYHCWWGPIYRIGRIPPGDRMLVIRSGEIGWCAKRPADLPTPVLGQWYHASAPPARVWIPIAFSENRQANQPVSWQHAGIYYFSLDTGYGSSYLVVLIRSWHLVAAFAIAPLVWAARRWRRYLAARREEVCRQCRYDLTGNVSGVCPECGTVIVEPRRA